MARAAPPSADSQLPASLHQAHETTVTLVLRALQLLSDERLAQLTARGSDPAFATLYGRYESTLFAYCRSITRNADDGWDAFQNAMVKALVAMKRTERDAPVRPWLFRIAHNEAIALLRRRCVAQKADLGRGDLTAAGADEEARCARA